MRLARRGARWGLVLLSAGCTVFEPYSREGAIDEGLAYDTAVRAFNTFPSRGTAWSADGTEVYYTRVGDGGVEIRAVDPVSGTLRTLASGLGSEGDLWPSPSGAWLYAEDRLGGEVLRVPTAGGAAEVVAETSGGFALSRDGRSLAASARGSLWLHDLEDGGASPLGTSAAPVAFSPDDTELLVRRASDGELRRIAGTGESSSLVWRRRSSPRWGLVRSAYWEGEALELVFDESASTGAHRLFLHDGRTGEYRFLTQLTSRTLADETFARSPDGATLAAWFDTQCLEATEGILSCDRWQWHLFVVDLETGQVGIRASSQFLSGEATPVALSFSPDGRSVAWVAKRRLVVKVIG